MRKTSCCFVALILVTPIIASCIDDECSHREPIPVSLLKFAGKAYTMDRWTWGEGSTVDGSVGNIWPAGTPAYGHYAFYSADRNSYGANYDEWLDIETGYYHLWHVDGTPAIELLPPEYGGEKETYLIRIGQVLHNNFAFLRWQKPHCAACANNAYLSRYLTDQVNRYTFTDEYLIPSGRLYFGGTLHYSPLFYQDGGCGYSRCADFSLAVGAAINLVETFPEAAGHYGLGVSSWTYTRELDLETGNLCIYNTNFKPTDPYYLEKIREAKDFTCSLYDQPIDGGEEWMYTKIAVMKDACDYLQYIIDRKAAPGP